MRALILTAGLGTRLRPLTLQRAKGAVPVNGEPLVRRIIRWLVAQGVTDLVLNLHHRPETIAAVVGDGQDLGARIRYSWEYPVLGSAGGPRRALPLLVDGSGGGTAEGGGSFLLINGDTLTDVRLDALLEFHAASGAAVSMALIPNPRPDAYGGVLVKGDRVTGFTRRGERQENYHFIGVQVASAEVFAGLEDGVAAESIGGLYPALIARSPGAVAAFVSDAAFGDIGTPADYLETSLRLAALEGDAMAQGAGSDVHPGAELRRTAVWDRVRIGPDARLEECIVCDGVTIPAGARFTRAAIVPYAGAPPQADERVESGLLIRQF